MRGVSYEGSLSSGRSLVRVVFQQVSREGSLSSGKSLMMVVFHQEVSCEGSLLARGLM